MGLIVESSLKQQLMKHEKGLKIHSENKWFLVISIDEFNKILSQFGNSDGRIFLSKLSQILGASMMEPQENTIIVGLMAGTMATTINAVFRDSSHDTMSMPLYPLKHVERETILSALDKFPREWKTCRKFRRILADVGGLPRLFEYFLKCCSKYIIDEIPITDWPYEELIIPEVSSYASKKYLAGASRFSVKLIEDAILQSPVYRDIIIDPEEKDLTTYGDLEMQADVLLVEQNDCREVISFGNSFVVSMPFLLLRWLTITGESLKNPAIVLLRKVFQYNGYQPITWQEFEEYVAICETVKTMLLYQRESRRNYDGPVKVNLAMFFNVDNILHDVIIPQNVKLQRAREQFPRNIGISDLYGNYINWDSEEGPVVINGTSAEFPDIFTVRKIAIDDNEIDVSSNQYYLICGQCKMYIDTVLTSDVIIKEINKTRDAITTFLPKYKDNWILIIYGTRVADNAIGQIDPRCIVLDSNGMERYFGKALVERGLYLLTHRKVNVNYFNVSELMQARGIGKNMQIQLFKNEN